MERTRLAFGEKRVAVGQLNVSGTKPAKVWASLPVKFLHRGTAQPLATRDAARVAGMLIW
ncbi:hypothetical protein SAMN04487785_105319 [Dyella jiangningensis]|nr:hypothetical protein BDW41_12046 [Dyella sp. AtDHG13]SDK14914.1 hypothetical protein SAMN04487785_105319 [Dyella jiangningensis]